MNKIEILLKKKDWVVVNKPSGLSVHNNEDKTNLLQELKAQGLEDFSPVNRLDKETSGIMVLSGNSEISSKLQASLSAKSTSKIYFAIVKGNFTKEQMSGVWKQDLTNKAEGRKNPLGVKSNRVKCTTNYIVLKSEKYLSLLQFKIETGRQHQIRKHCILAKHQIVGDSRYGDKKFNSLISQKYSFDEMALHSHQLSFIFESKTYQIKSAPPKSWKALGILYNEESLTL